MTPRQAFTEYAALHGKRAAIMQTVGSALVLIGGIGLGFLLATMVQP